MENKMKKYKGITSEIMNRMFESYFNEAQLSLAQRIMDSKLLDKTKLDNFSFTPQDLWLSGHCKKEYSSLEGFVDDFVESGLSVPTVRSEYANTYSLEFVLDRHVKTKRPTCKIRLTAFKKEYPEDPYPTI